MKDIIRFMRLENGCKVGDFYMKLITKELKLIADGTPNGTKIVNAKTNEELEDIYSAHFIAKANHIPHLIIKVWMPQVTVDIDTDDYEIFMTSNHKSRKEIHKFTPRKNLE